MAPELPEEKSAAPSRTGRKSPLQDRGISRARRAVPVEADRREAAAKWGGTTEDTFRPHRAEGFLFGAGQ